MFERLRSAIGRGAAKATESVLTLPWFPTWVKHAWPVIQFRRLVSEGYRLNSAVFACVRVHANQLPEPPLMVWQRDGRDLVPIEDHPCRILLREPNPFMSEVEFWEYFWTYACVGGSVFVWKERDRTGQVVALWPLHRGQMAPVPDASGWIGGYEYYAEGEGYSLKAIPVPTSDVIQFRWAIDPLNPIDGLAPLVAAARASDTDSLILKYVFNLMNNDARPSSVVAFKVPLSKTAGDELKRRFQEKYGGDNIGSTAIIEGTEVSISRLGMNLNEMAAESLHNIPETRISAAFEVPAVLANLNVGLQRAINANAKELREFYVESGCVPRWRKCAALFGARLLRDEFDGKGLVCAFDLAQVRALQDDEDARRARIRQDFAAGLVSFHESRAQLGFTETGGTDFYLRSAVMIEVPALTVAEAAAQAILASQQTAAPGLSLNGAQIESLLNIVQLIGHEPGQIPKDLAVELIVTAFNVPRERVEAILALIPDAGTGAPAPGAPAALPAPAGGKANGRANGHAAGGQRIGIDAATQDRITALLSAPGADLDAIEEKLAGDVPELTARRVAQRDRLAAEFAADVERELAAIQAAAVAAAGGDDGE